MANKPLPTPDELRQLLRYDEATGKIFWLPRSPELFKSDGHNGCHRSSLTWNKKHAGREASGNANNHGYMMISLFKRLVGAHRVAWAIVHGQWPVGEIDHINGHRSDNRINNLRDVSSQDNKRNAARRADNSSGVAGVSRRPQSSRWRARIFIDGGEKSLGTYSTLPDAIAARKAAEIRYGFHPNHGR